VHNFEYSGCNWRSRSFTLACSSVATSLGFWPGTLHSTYFFLPSLGSACSISGNGLERALAVNS
jgi:hypothetical protein